jgi:urocanate hydratase
VTNGVARRAWARNSGAITSIQRAMDMNPLLHVTVPEIVDDALLDEVFGDDRND